MSGKFLHGALIQVSESFGVVTPNVIIFQFNPEKLTHSWTPLESELTGGQGTNPLAVRGLPSESFTFTLVMDANDQIAEGNPLAIASGISSRLAALEMLLFPISSDSQLGASLATTVDSAPAGTLNGLGEVDDQTVPAGVLPFALFVWGPSRVLPVRVQSLSITETLYDVLLNPTHAEADITLQVLTKQDLETVAASPLVDLGIGAYDYTHGARQALALANVANAAQAPIGIVPFL
jgi:hypothetical protein